MLLMAPHSEALAPRQTPKILGVPRSGDSADASTPAASGASAERFIPSNRLSLPRVLSVVGCIMYVLSY